MKRILYTLVFLFSVLQIDAQDIRAIDFFVNVNEFPRSWAELANLGENYSLEAFNNTESQIDFYLTVEVYRNDEKYAYTDPNYTQIALSLGPGEFRTFDKDDTNLLPEDIFPTYILPESFQQASLTTVLPEGDYMICVSAYTMSLNNQPILISEGYPISCSETYTINHDAQAIPLFPVDCVPVNDIDDNEEVFFDWAVMVLDEDDYEYTFKLVELTESYINANDLLFADGMPAVVEETVNEQEYTIEDPSSILTVGSRYAWRVESQSNNLDGTDPEAVSYYSEIMVFEYGGDDCMNGQISDTDSGNILEYNCENCIITSQIKEEKYSGNTLPATLYAGYFEVEVVEKGTSILVEEERIFNGAEGIVKVKLAGLDFKIPVGVTMDELIINKDRQMKSGTIVTKPLELDQSIFDSELTLPDGTETSLESLKEFASSEYDNYITALEVGDELLQQVNNLMANEGLEMPLGIDQEFNGKEYRLTIDEFNFNANGALCRATINFPLPVGVFSEEGSIKYISFSTNNLCITPDGSFGPGNIAMQKQLTVFENNNGFDLYLDGCEDCDNTNAEDTGSYLSFDCNGVTGGQIDCRLNFPNEADVGPDGFYLKPYLKSNQNTDEGIETPENVSASFRLKLEENDEQDGIQWLAAVNVTPFEMSVFKDWGFTINNAMIDLSENVNPNPESESSTIFPAGHNDYGQIIKSDGTLGDPAFKDILNTWTGLHLKEVAVHIPESLNSDVGNTFTVYNGVFDFFGNYNFSMTIAAKDIDQEFDVSGWGLSLDEINVPILNKTFVQGNMIGNLSAPFLAKGDSFLYTASILSEDDNLNYAFTIRTESGSEDNKVNIPLMLAEANLSGSSHITLNYDPQATTDAFQFEANLIGDLRISPETIDWIDDPNLEDLPLELSGIPFLLKYNKNDGFKGSGIALNYDIEQIINSEISAIENDIQSVENAFNPTPESQRNKEMLGISLDFKKVEIGGTLENPSLTLEPRLMVMDDGSQNSTATGFGLDARIIMEAIMVEGRIEYDDARLECLGLDIQSSAIYIRGSVCYIKDRIEKKKVLQGEIVVDISGLGGGIAANASFGTKYHDSALKNEDFSFWYAKLAVKINTGISLAPIPVAIYGMGGGIFYNYKAPFNGDFMADFGRGSFEPPQDKDKLYSTSGLEPSKGSYGLALWALFGPTGKPESFNFDVTIGLNFSANSLAASVAGSAYLMTDDMWRSKSNLQKNSIAYGGLFGTFQINDISSGDCEFLLSADVGVNIPPPGSDNKSPIIYTTGGGDGNSPGAAQVEVVSNLNEFHAYVGVPGNFLHTRFDGSSMGPVSVKAKLGGTSINSEFYLMFGDGLPTTLYLPDEITDLLNSSIDEDADVSNAVSSTNTSRPPVVAGSGFAMGSMLKLTCPWFVEYEGKFKTGIDGFGLAGFDINVTKSLDRKCRGRVPGINGWYAMGQIYAGLDFQAYMLGKRFVNLNAVAVMQGGLPNPLWFTTRVKLNYDITTDAITGSIVTATLELAEETNLFDMKNDVEWISEDGDGDSFWENLGDLEIGDALGQLADATTITNEGYFRFDFEYGDQCIPYIDYQDSEEIVVPLIQSISPQNNSELNDVFSTEVKLNLFVGHKKALDVQIVENGKILDISMKPKLDYFRIKKGSHVLVSKGVSDLGVNKKELIISGLALEPNTWYDVEAKMSLFRGSSRFDSQILKQRFKTGDVPTEFKEEYVISTFPEKWHNYVRVDDYDYGYIQLQENLYNLAFNPSALQGTENSNSNFSFPDFSFNSMFNSSNNLNPSITNNSSDISIGIPSNSVVNTNLPSIEDISNDLGLQANKWRFLLRNRKDQSDEQILEVIRNHDKKRLEFDINGLEPSSKYELILQSKDSITYNDAYSLKFNTSEFRTIVDKFNSIQKSSTSGNNKKLKLVEPFDSYDIKHLKIYFGVNHQTLDNIADGVEDLLNVNQRVNLQSATISEGNSGGTLSGFFKVRKNRWITINFQNFNHTYRKTNEFRNLFFSSLLLMKNKFLDQYSAEGLAPSDYLAVKNSEIGFEKIEPINISSSYINISWSRHEMNIPLSISNTMKSIFTGSFSAVQSFLSQNIIDADNNPWKSDYYDSIIHKNVNIPNQWSNYFSTVTGGSGALSALALITLGNPNTIVDDYLKIKFVLKDPNSIHEKISSDVFNNW